MICGFPWWWIVCFCVILETIPSLQEGICLGVLNLTLDSIWFAKIHLLWPFWPLQLSLLLLATYIIGLVYFPLEFFWRLHLVVCCFILKPLLSYSPHSIEIEPNGCWVLLVYYITFCCFVFLSPIWGKGCPNPPQHHCWEYGS